MEVFKEIKGYEGLYEVSNRGNVKSLKRKNRLNEILLKIHLSTAGYQQVLLTKQGKSKTYQVHQLMAIAFLNHIPNGNRTVVDNIDNVKTNNKLENLQNYTYFLLELIYIFCYCALYAPLCTHSPPAL
jgi:hypothetical protein